MDLVSVRNFEEPSYGEDLLAALRSYSWPGNVREVARLAARTVMLHRGEKIDESSLADYIKAKRMSWDYRENLRTHTDDFKRRFLRSALELCDGNITRTADLIGVARPSLQRMLKEFGIERR